MKIVVNHQINDVNGFWASAQQHLPNLPEMGVSRVIQVMPNPEMSQATCLWEADSIESLDRYLRDKVSNMSSETYHEVNEANQSLLNTSY